MAALPQAVTATSPTPLPWQKRAAPSAELVPRTEEIATFLRSTIADAIHLVAIVPEGPAPAGRWFDSNALDAAIWATECNAEGANVYWTVNQVRPGLNTKPKKADIVAARFTHVDIDPPKDGAPWQREQVLDALAELDSPPSFVLDSGGGLQAFWRLEEASLNLAAIEDANRGIQARFGGDPCWNIDRLMRLPGTVNWPDARKRARGRVPALASIAVEDDGVVHEPFVLAHQFPPPAPSEATDRPEVSTAPAPLITADDLGLAAFDPLRMMIERPASSDRSADALALAGEMVRKGYADAQIMGVLLNPDNSVAAHCLAKGNPSRAAARCLSKAHGDQSRVEAETAEGATLARDMGIAAEPEQPRSISATPYVGRPSASIPLRPWVYGRYLLRNTIAAVVAPGGIGKSSLMVGTALALATGRDLLGKPVWDGPKTVWLWNLEDDGDELARQIEGACVRHGIGPDDYAGRLYVDSGLDGAGLCTAVEGREGCVVLKPVYEALAAEILARRIDVLIVDPFVSSHQVDENANVKIDAIAKEWARLAKRCSCSIVLVHHAKKVEGRKITSEASRGAIALIAAARSTLVLNRLDDDDGQRLNIPPRERRRYFSVGDDKHNRAPAEAADWYRLDSVSLGNGGLEGGDSVGVVVPWTPPKAAEQISVGDLRRVQTAIASGSWRYDTRAKESWVGVAVAETLGLSTEQDKPRILELIKQWLAGGALIRRPVKSAATNWMEKTFVEVGIWVDPSVAGPMGTDGVTDGPSVEQPMGISVGD